MDEMSSPLAELPEGILLDICEQLTLGDLGVVSLVNREMRRVAGMSSPKYAIWADVVLVALPPLWLVRSPRLPLLLLHLDTLNLSLHFVDLVDLNASLSALADVARLLPHLTTLQIRSKLPDQSPPRDAAPAESWRNQHQTLGRITLDLERTRVRRLCLRLVVVRGYRVLTGDVLVSIAAPTVTALVMQFHDPTDLLYLDGFLDPASRLPSLEYLGFQADHPIAVLEHLCTHAAATVPLLRSLRPPSISSEDDRDVVRLCLLLKRRTRLDLVAYVDYGGHIRDVLGSADIVVAGVRFLMDPRAASGSAGGFGLGWNFPCAPWEFQAL